MYAQTKISIVVKFQSHGLIICKLHRLYRGFVSDQSEVIRFFSLPETQDIVPKNSETIDRLGLLCRKPVVKTAAHLHANV